MKDYLKSYIDTLSEDRLNEDVPSSIIIDTSKHEREESRLQENNTISKTDQPNTLQPSEPISRSKKTLDKKEEKRRKYIQDNPQWDIYKERIFAETILHQRFNYFLIVYALTILSAAIINTRILQSIILATGIFILTMLWFNLVKVHIELEEVCNIFHKTLNKNNVLNIIENKIEERQSFLSQLPMNSILTYGVPALCIVSMLCYLMIILFVI